ncbi:MAG: putative toxin-antitoxin system toxin component, PIN family [Acidimicrobiales bacterium]
MLDTNTLVSGLGWSGPPSVIVDAVLAGELLMVSSPPLLDELERVLAYPKLAAVFPDPAGIVGRVRAAAEMIEPGFTLAVVADEPDNRVLEAAVEARSDAVVTGDAGLLNLEAYDGIPIMSAMRFLEWRKNSEH